MIVLLPKRVTFKIPLTGLAYTSLDYTDLYQIRPILVKENLRSLAIGQLRVRRGWLRGVEVEEGIGGVDVGLLGELVECSKRCTWRRRKQRRNNRYLQPMKNHDSQV